MLERETERLARTVVIVKERRVLVFIQFVQFMRSGRSAGAGDP